MTDTHTRLTALCPGLPGWAGTRKVKTNLDFTDARDSEWQWHQLDHMQVCTSLQTDNHTSTPPLSFLQAGCPSCRPTNSVKALKANIFKTHSTESQKTYCGLYKNISMMRSRPLAWLKNTNKLQWISHVRCWSRTKGDDIWTQKCQYLSTNSNRTFDFGITTNTMWCGSAVCIVVSLQSTVQHSVVHAIPMLASLSLTTNTVVFALTMPNPM